MSINAAETVSLRHEMICLQCEFLTEIVQSVMVVMCYAMAQADVVCVQGNGQVQHSQEHNIGQVQSKNT